MVTPATIGTLARGRSTKCSALRRTANICAIIRTRDAKAAFMPITTSV